MSNYKGCIDTLSSYSTAMRANCIMRNPSIPFDVMTSNLDAGRPLDSAIGFTKSGYIPSSRRFQTKYEGVHNLWVSTSKSIPSMMSKRFKRDEIKTANIRFQQLEDMLIDLIEKHDQDKKTNIWEMIVQWRPIMAEITLISLMFIIIQRGANILVM